VVVAVVVAVVRSMALLIGGEHGIGLDVLAVLEDALARDLGALSSP